MDYKDGSDMKYVIYGRIYRLTRIRREAGILYGYCKKRRKWAWIYDDHHLMFEGEFPINATRIM